MARNLSSLFSQARAVVPHSTAEPDRPAEPCLAPGDEARAAPKAENAFIAISSESSPRSVIGAVRDRSSQEEPDMAPASPSSSASSQSLHTVKDFSTEMYVSDSDDERMRFSNDDYADVDDGDEADEIETDWVRMFQVIGNGVTSRLGLGAAGGLSAARLTCRAWAKEITTHTHSMAPFGSLETFASRLSASFPSLTLLDLKLAGGPILQRDLDHFADAYSASLTSLSLARCSISKCSFAGLQKLRSLTALNLSDCNLHRKQHLAHLPPLLHSGLTSLDLSNCMLIDDKGFLAMTGHPAQQQYPSKACRLQELNLTGCHGLTEESILLLAEHRDIAESLTSLNLSGCQDMDSSVVRIIACHFPNLKELDLTGIAGLRDTDLSLLRSLRGLRVLRCGSTSLSGIWLEVLSHLTELEELSLRGSVCISDSTLGCYFPVSATNQALSKLRTLDLSNCCHLGGPMTWRVICRLPSLTSLDLSHTTTGSAEISTHVDEMQNIRHLNLEGCRGMSDTGVAACSALRNLRSLNVRSLSYKVSYYTISSLEDKLDCLQF